MAGADRAAPPLRLARLERCARGRFGILDALGRHHLLKAHDQGLDLRLLAGERQRAARPAGQEEELPLAGLSDRRNRDLLDRVKLENWHVSNSLPFDGFGALVTGKTSGR